MKIRLPKILIGLIFGVGFLAVSNSGISATEGDILLSDDFNDGNLDGWTIEYGNWYVNRQGNLAGSNSGVMLGGKINTSNSEWDNYRIDLDVNGFQGVDGGVGFRYTPNGNSYQLDLKFAIGTYNSPEAILRKTEDGKTTILGDTHTITLQGQTWYHLKIETSNDRVKIWIHNDLIFDITDTGTKVKKGTLAFSYWTGALGVAYMKFDNVRVTALAPPPPPRLPVIFIPGIGGSEMKTAQDIIWSAQDGHGGTYSHAYSNNEKIWVNQDKAAELGDDDYFDVLRLKPDGITSEAALTLTGELTSFGYPDIDSFFTGMGYIKGTNYFVFPYDWRKDVRSTKDSLDSLIESAKTASGQSKVNLVVHSMGGLVARYYISDLGRAAKVNQLIELGVPHLGATSALKTLMYGTALQKNVFGFIPLGIPASEIKDISRNMPSLFQLLPSNKYFNFYNDSSSNFPFPFRDDRDIDDNKITGILSFDQIKSLLLNLSYNMSVFSISEQFHNLFDSTLNQTNNVKTYEIVGTAQPTLGQIHETWWITWPVNLLPKTDEIFINGDGTVPLYSASLKNDSLDISGATKIYYTEQGHGDLVTNNGTAMQTVKAILNDDNAFPVEVKYQKISLEGQQISVDNANLDIYDDLGNHTGLKSNGDLETNIADTFYDSIGTTKHVFVKKSKKVTAKITSSKTIKTKIKIRKYSGDSITKTIFYNDVPVTGSSTLQLTIDPSSSATPALSDSTQTLLATSEATGSAALDQTPPVTSIQISGTKNSSGIYTGPVTITLTGTDLGSGILKIEYSLDNGQTVQTYNGPFTISTSGKTTIQVKSIDNLGNEEIPQSITVEIAVSPSPTPTPASTTTANTSKVGSVPSDVLSFEVSSVATSPVIASEAKQSSLLSNPTQIASSQIPRNDNSDILGLTFQNPNHISDQINISKLVETQKKLIPYKNPEEEFLSGLLIISGGIITLASFGLLATFLKKAPHKM